MTSETDNPSPEQQDLKKFTVKYVLPDTLKPYHRNTKIHSEEHVRKLVKILDKYSFDQPIVVSPDMVIIKGHGRYMASLMTAQKKLVPIIVRDDLTEEQMTAARISDNRLFELGESIPELIKQEVMDFVAEGGSLETQFLEFLPKGQPFPLTGVAPQNMAGVDEQSEGPDDQNTLKAVTPPMAPAAPASTTKTINMSTDVPEPEKVVKAKAAPLVYCPNCNQLHTE